MIVDAMCVFIAPILEFNTREVCFEMEQVREREREKGNQCIYVYLSQEPGSQLDKHVKDIMLKNISPLPLTALFTSDYPFRLSVPHSKQFGAKQVTILSLCVCIYYSSFSRGCHY